MTRAPDCATWRRMFTTSPHTRSKLATVSTFSALALVLAACGSSSSDPGGTVDTGTPSGDSSGVDTTVPEGGADTGTKSDAVTDTKKEGGTTDTAPADTAPPPGTKLGAGDYSVIGVTDDDYAVALDNSSGALVAIALAGGAPATIDAASDASFVIGKVVFSWSGVDATSGVGKLTVWTHDGGAKSPSTASIAYVGGASPDGAYIMYTSAATSAPKADVVFSTLDGATKKTIANADASGSCGVGITYKGSRFVTSYCTDATGSATVASIDNTGAATTLLAGALFIGVEGAVDSAGTKVFVISSGNAASVVPIAGGAATAIDTGVAYGAMASDGSRVVYRTTTEGMKSSPLAGVSPIVLVTTGAKIFGGVSPDGKYALYSNASDATSGLTDLFMVATTAAAATPVTLNSKTDTDLADFATAWTADSSHVLFSTAVDGSTLTGQMNAQAVTGTTATSLGKDVWQIFQLTGAKIIINDGFTDDGSTKRADIRVGDTATATAPALLVGQAGVAMMLNKAKTKVVYDFNIAASTAGLYVLALP